MAVGGWNPHAPTAPQLENTKPTPLARFPNLANLTKPTPLARFPNLANLTLFFSYFSTHLTCASL